MQGDDLQNIRRELGWTQQVMAAELGLTPQFIGMMERGEKPIEVRTELAVKQLFNANSPLYDRMARPAYEDDVPLDRAQIIWDTDVEGIPPVRVIDVAGKDDRRYDASYGACNAEWHRADDVGRLLRLFSRFQELTALHGIDPQEVHKAFWVIPEYRFATAYDFVLRAEQRN